MAFGTNYSKYFCDKGYKVAGLDNLSGGYRDFVDSRAEIYSWDIKHAL